jgi:hypothetical protein
LSRCSSINKTNVRMTYLFSTALKKMLLLACLAFSVRPQAQTFRIQQNQVLAYNILSNGLMGGIGGLINKKPGEKWHKVFLRNFGKGCLGGIVKYSAKTQTYYLRFPQNNFLALPNRLYYFLGHSMVMNASANKKLFSTYYCNLLGIDMRWYIKDRAMDVKPLEARLSVQSAISVFGMIHEGQHLDIYRSLEMGMFYFELDTNYRHPIAGLVSGISGFNTIAIATYGNSVAQSFAIPHETVHTYQYYDMFPLRNLVYPRYMEKPLMKNRVYTRLSKYLVLDFESYIYSGLYTIQPRPLHYRNFYEFEAEHFSGRQYIPR